jgi:hypothetical protein
MKTKIILLLSLLFISLSSYCQLSNLTDPIRKDEAYCRALMKNEKAAWEDYGESGKTVHYSYPDYLITFTFIKNRCVNVRIDFVVNEDVVDKTMYHWLYEKNYESAFGGTLWGKMLPQPGRSDASFPVAVQKLDKSSWWLYDVLYYSDSH